ncbi:hypothetical protein GSI_02848 [Ganoderma sinense ZZ0214-1]|uniref:Uncharacterized protein n=1 Tax=Ganoderma sinense ZZ0214-1 TaxID=1077348 RepID=A0A2G8SMS8_9APHY|nr:hypothetical protein GSI_02848 [Ganoderma sinense ZZ0214-1]
MSLESPYPGCDTNGWITDIPAGVTVHKGRAIDLYHLHPADLDGVEFEHSFYQKTGRYFNKYKERDVEWRAWEIHGGPIEYWKFLKREQQRRPSHELYTIPPYSYRRRAQYDLSLLHPPTLQDRYVCDSATLRGLKASLAPWIWNACNVALDHVFLHGRIPLMSCELVSDREPAMRLALSFIHSHPIYSERPTQPLGSSPSMTQLRAVLNQAPIAPAPGSPRWGARIDGLVFDEEGSYYEWDRDFLERVFGAACGVVEELGTGDAGMRSARWEIYDKYSESPGFGLWYDPTCHEWTDNAADWLDDRLSGEELRNHLRSTCPAGTAYNNLLLHNAMNLSVKSLAKLRSPSRVLPTPEPSQ